MKISIITVFPEIYESFLSVSLIKKAIGNRLVTISLFKFSDFVNVKGRIDEPTCGPGSGMIIKPEVMQKAIEKAESEHGKGFKIFFSPQGEKLTQPLLRLLSQKFFSKGKDVNDKSEVIKDNTDHIILVASRYEGIDERVKGVYADMTISLGDYILMGGDLPAQVFLEGLLRLLPGVVGKKESVERDSFSSSFLDYPEYGLPVEWNGKKVPEVILSGNHEKIEKWRSEQSAKKTVENRFDWFSSCRPSKKEIEVAKKFIPNHYVALMHTDILVKKDLVGNSSITSLDIHDIARSCATYGIENYFLVTPLKDQQKILGTFLDFWKSKEGKDYNLSRFVAVSRIVPSLGLNEVIKYIKEKEGVEPLIITTSARFKDADNKNVIDFHSQGKVFKQKRPVLILFGTARGLCEEVIKRSDFLLNPIIGLTDYNHLSVRSAAAIIFDRWLGVNFKNIENIDETS